MRLDLAVPVVDNFVKRFAIGNVVHEHDYIRVFVKYFINRAKRLLTGSVPNVEFEFLLIGKTNDFGFMRAAQC